MRPVRTLRAPDYVNHCPLCGWPEGQPWITVEQAAASLAIAPRKLREMINAGAFSQVMKVARRWRIHHEALDSYITATRELVGSGEKNRKIVEANDG